MLCIDDYIGFRILDLQTDDIKVDKEAVKRALTEKGLEVHKEEWGPGLQRRPGIAARGRPFQVTAHPEKLGELAPATEALVVKPFVPPARLSLLLGMWTWALVICPSGSAILDSIYKWINERDEAWGEVLPLWNPVISELMAPANLSAYFAANLEAEWAARADLSDAPAFGYSRFRSKREG
eukprot:7453052-Pyramimonas_sp.AAC.1